MCIGNPNICRFSLQLSIILMKNIYVVQLKTLLPYNKWTYIRLFQKSFWFVYFRFGDRDDIISPHFLGKQLNIFKCGEFKYTKPGIIRELYL